MAEHGLRFDADTARAIGKAEARATRDGGRLALWVIAGAAGVYRLGRQLSALTALIAVHTFFFCDFGKV